MGISPLMWGLVATSQSPGLIFGLVSSAAWTHAVTARLVRASCSNLFDARRMGYPLERPEVSALPDDMPEVSRAARPTAPACRRCGVYRHAPAGRAACRRAPVAAAG